ncbi:MULTISPECIES: type II toxin-antitoxin system HicA family toxin [Leptolyngbya]|uniref:type II toxin-antitoxin system HicA family toxin n=1 Tax=Leptolyngbya TaxID=47251 RepID=UPI001688F5E8|nr:type II toxin-antitoxin system HicA family toxin [Leptolyngbya sp. FACHB-1624]MBD1856474.1 hypothetical protein [Leptolyngbya sp. FACHB-1624]
MSQQFKQKLIAQGWRFKRFGKGSHQIWSHPQRGTIAISLSAMKQRISKGLERQLFGL